MAKLIKILNVFIALGIVILVILISFSFTNKGATISKPLINEIKETPKKEVVKIVLVGDIMLDRMVEAVMLNNKDWRWPFLKTADYLKSADITFGNLESVISDKGYKVGSIYSFRANPKAIEGLTFSGFDVLSLVNNHSFDYTYKALNDTALRLNATGISPVYNFNPIIKEAKGLKVGFLAYTNLGPEIWKATDNKNGIAWISENDFEKIKENIKSLKEKVDIVIISLHSGEEYQTKPNEFQKNFSKMAMDAGADIIAGHHPHVVQPYEEYNDGWIFYSLGNFIFDQTFSTSTKEGLIAEITVTDKKITEVTTQKTQLNSSLQPVVVD